MFASTQTTVLPQRPKSGSVFPLFFISSLLWKISQFPQQKAFGLAICFVLQLYWINWTWVGSASDKLCPLSLDPAHLKVKHIAKKKEIIRKMRRDLNCVCESRR